MTLKSAVDAVVVVNAVVVVVAANVMKLIFCYDRPRVFNWLFGEKGNGMVQGGLQSYSRKINNWKERQPSTW